MKKMDFSFTADALAKGAGIALDGIISMIHSLKEFGFKTFEKLYYACVVPILVLFRLDIQTLCSD